MGLFVFSAVVFIIGSGFMHVLLRRHRVLRELRRAARRIDVRGTHPRIQTPRHTPPGYEL